MQICAQIGNSAQVIAQLAVMPATLSALTLNPASVGGGNASTGSVMISGPAPSGGLVFTLSSDATTSASPSRPGPATKISELITLPQQVTIPAGATTASFPITTRPVTTSTPVQITSAWSVFVTKTATLTLLPPAVASVSLGNYGGGAVSGGNTITGTVTLNAPVPSEDITVYLTTSLAYGGTTGTFPQCGQVPTVPSTTKVDGGSTSDTFTVTTYPGYGVYWVSAHQAPTDCSTETTVYNCLASLTLNPPVLTWNSPILPSSVKGGTPTQGTIQLAGPAMPTNCAQYTLASK